MLFSSCPPRIQDSGIFRPINTTITHVPPCGFLRPLLECAPMPFSIRPFRCFTVHCSVSYNARPFQGHVTAWNRSCTGRPLSGDLPMRPGETLSLTVTLPNAQRIEVPEVVVRWSSGQEFAVENLVIEAQADVRFHHVVTRVMQEPTEIVL